MDKDKQLQVRHHNAITNARHDLSAVQLDIYFMLLSKLKPGDNNRYEISIREIQDLTGREWNYQQLRDATSGLIGKVFEIDEEDGLLQVALMSSAKYLKGQGRIQLTVAEELKPYLVGLKNNFTSFQLFCVLSMSSKYAKWLYLQFSRWKDLGGWSVDVEELRIKLSLKDPKGKSPEVYKQWGQLKDYVIEPSLKQINDGTDIKVSYTTEKRGKTIERLHFAIQHMPQYQILIPFDIPEDDRDAVNLKARMNKIGIVNEELINSVLSNDELRNKARKVLYNIDMNKANISSPAGYFRASIGV